MSMWGTSVCVYCKKTFKVRNSDLKRGYGKYCCRQHAVLDKSTIPLGIENAIIYYHPRHRKYYRLWRDIIGNKLRMHTEHIWVYMCKYGSIPKGYRVERIDGDVNNNDISNLRLKKTSRE